MSYVLVDSNVLLDILTQDRQWYAWSTQQVHDVVIQRVAAINPLIYAEVSSGYASPEATEAALAPLSLHRVQLPWEAAYPAGQTFREYRRRGGAKTSPLPDFYIGAHAQVSGFKLLTRDVNRYRTYFPAVELICP